MRTRELDYLLPPEAVAQEPVEPRHDARLLVDRPGGGEVAHRTVRDLPDLLRPGDVVVVNETRVAPARMHLRKPTGGRVEVPLPPYVHRPVAPERYQTVYARHPTSAAAPTAGLHLSEQVLAGIAAAGIGVVRLDLGISVATFRPVTAERLEDHVMGSERYDIPPDTWAACRQARRVVAVGTTAVRALETAAVTGSLAGSSNLFIRPGHTFAVIDVLLTNFHLPRSTLLSLLCAFMGDRWRRLYETALGDGYRFGSFGDAMLVSRC